MGLLRFELRFQARLERNGFSFEPEGLFFSKRKGALPKLESYQARLQPQRHFVGAVRDLCTILLMVY